ncbi:Fis family transcriptional regulator [Actinotalea ferrariae CF5-4]|uniref:Fis family transcriptional regulator n=1 Tax=Actinotalea ferrariae CF5-4 TaxID=948458 RepID=A0A021VRZ8_9CELL|nr:helix-turn-helix domain-containing protein [Actinotalea ferrariae]EYR63979.1 Fis family transcriptional regulator [Actinotalea ferrariae CF5-4]
MATDEIPARLRAVRREAAGPAPERLVASWRRSHDYGVSDEGVDPVFVGAVDEESLFYRCGNRVLENLHATLADEPLAMMLTDSRGLVLNRFVGDAALVRALDDVHLAPGFVFSEREVGTNGLGLALADRAPSLVHADEHYSVGLVGFTCAAVPVLDPLTGRLEGSINLTTSSASSSALLLALAQSAASNTADLMLARSRGRSPRRQPRGEVFRVLAPRHAAGSDSLVDLGPTWRAALDDAARALASGQVVAAVGEDGSGRGTLLALAHRRGRPRDRILGAATPDPEHVEAWLRLWTSELGKPSTAVIVHDVDRLPEWAAQRLRDLLEAERARSRRDGEQPMLTMTAENFAEIPDALAALVDRVVPVAPLRERPEDVLPLAAHAARRVRGRDIGVTVTAQRTLEAARWPGNVQQLVAVVTQAAQRTDLIDLQHLPLSIVSTSGHRLTRLESLERQEIARSLARPGATPTTAAKELGMSRATMYRKLAHYGIPHPGPVARRRV